MSKLLVANVGDPRRMYFFTGENKITVLAFLTPRNSVRLLYVKVLLQSKRYVIYKLPNHTDTRRCGRMQDRMGMKNTKKTTLRMASLLPMKRDRTGQPVVSPSLLDLPALSYFRHFPHNRTVSQNI